mgnify:CR=1 FL=1
MDSTEANYKITLYGLIFGSVVSIIGALSKCFLKSRCTNIKTPCVSCDRDVLDDNSSQYEDAESNFKSTPKLRV